MMTPETMESEIRVLKRELADLRRLVIRSRDELETVEGWLCKCGHFQENRSACIRCGAPMGEQK